MSNYNERLQSLYHEFSVQNGRQAASSREVAQWAVQMKYLDLPRFDPFARLAEDFSKALREEYRTDAEGRRYRVNHSVRVTRNGVQMTLWADIRSATRKHMQSSFRQRREQIVGDCVQLNNDIEHYNSMNPEQPPIQMLLDFRDDVLEAALLREVA